MNDEIKKVFASARLEHDLLLDELASLHTEQNRITLRGVSINQEDHNNRMSILAENIRDIRDDITALEARTASSVLNILSEQQYFVIINADTGDRLQVTPENLNAFLFFAKEAKFYWENGTLMFNLNLELKLESSIYK